MSVVRSEKRRINRSPGMEQNNSHIPPLLGFTEEDLKYKEFQDHHSGYSNESIGERLYQQILKAGIQKEPISDQHYLEKPKELKKQYTRQQEATGESLYNQIFTSTAGENTGVIDSYAEKYIRDIIKSDMKYLETRAREELKITYYDEHLLDKVSEKIEPEKEKEEKSLVFSNEYSFNFGHIIECKILNKYNIKLCKFVPFSCGILSIGGIEQNYNVFGIEGVYELMNFIINNFNNTIDNMYDRGIATKATFILVSLTNRHDELNNYFYSISDCASSTEKNPNTPNKITVFTIKLKQ